MNFQEIEKLRTELASFIPQINGLPKVLVLFSFYEKLLLTKDNNLINAFAPEFMEEYLTELDNYSPLYSEPKRTEQILKQLSELKRITLFENKYSKIEELISSINKKLNNLFAVLEGNASQLEKRKKLLFPLLGTVVTSSETFIYASIEPVTVKVTTAKHKDSFVFIPSHQKREQLEEQTKISFQLALQYLCNYKHKFHKYHEVLIYFDNISADYEGYSLGIALTIGFIEQLSILYNLPYLTIVKNNIASTGGLDKNGNVFALGEEIINQKVEAAFYSDLENLIIPEDDEATGKEKLRILKEKFPERKLNIVPVENLSDLLNRRNLIEIKKQSPVVRTAKNIRRNWKATTIVFALLAALIFNFWIDWDDNPAILENIKRELLVKNKTGKLLWKQEVPYDDEYGNASLKDWQRIIDINSDGVNEVILCSQNNSEDGSKIVCFSNHHNIVWEYIFADSIPTTTEYFTNKFWLSIVGTTTINGNKQIVLSAKHFMYYPSAIFKLDLKTGKRLTGTYWNPGYIDGGFLYDINQDGKDEAVLTAANNGYESTSIMSLRLDSLSGQSPTTKKYEFNKIKTETGSLINFTLIPKSDYSFYKAVRLNGLLIGGLLNYTSEKIIAAPIIEGERIEQSYVIYRFDYSLACNEVVISNNLRVRRDSLVAHDKLKTPFTDTPEYCKILRDQILYWNGKEFTHRDGFVKREELK